MPRAGIAAGFNGKPFSELQAGRYSVSDSDADSKAGVWLQKSGSRPVVLSGAAFVGRRTVSVHLTAGTWVLYASTAAGRVTDPFKSMVRGGLSAALALSAALVLALGAASSSAAVSQTITAGIDQNRDLTMTFADGTSIGSAQTPGTVIPPGTYTVNVNDDSDIANFDLQGPGVNFASGVEAFIQLTWTVTFQPCSQYSYQSDTQAGSNVWFQTSVAAGSTTACASTSLTSPGTVTTTGPAAPPPRRVQERRRAPVARPPPAAPSHRRQSPSRSCSAVRSSVGWARVEPSR